MVDPVTGIATFSGTVLTTDGRTLAFDAELAPPVAGSAEAVLTYRFPSIPVDAAFTLVHEAELNDPPPQNTRTYASTATIFDDGSNGLDRNPANNTATDVNDLEVFVFDSGLDFRPAGVGDAGSFATAASRSAAERSGPAAYGIASGFGDGDRVLGGGSNTIDPVYTGSAAPGSSVNVELYDSLGNRVGTRSVTADAAGSWALSLPSAVIAAEEGRSPDTFTGSRNFGYDHRLFGERVSLLGYGDGIGGNAVGTLLGGLSLTSVVSGEGGGFGLAPVGDALNEAAAASFAPASGEPVATGTRVGTPGVFAGTSADAVAAAAAASRSPVGVGWIR